MAQVITIQQAFTLASQHHQAGRLAEAEQLYRKILAQQPNHAGALHYLGVIAHQMGRIDAAVDLIRRSIALQPDCAGALSNLGNVLKDSGQLDAAIVACRQAIALRPDLPEAHTNLGNALKDGGQLDEAIAAFRQAIALRPNYAVAHSNLGVALMERGQVDEAIRVYRQAIAIRPNYAEAHNNLGNALMKKRQIDEAIAAYRQAISIRPGYGDAYGNLGNALTEKGQLDEAIAACRQAIILAPEASRAHNNLGNALKDAGEVDAAIAAYRQAVALKPDFSEAYSNLGGVLSHKGQLDEAIAVCRQAIACNSNLPEAYNNLGNALQEKGQLDEAIAACRQAIAIRPSYAEAHNNLGVALMERGEVDSAIAAYREAIALNSNFARAHSNLGNALSGAGQLDGAIAAYRRAIAIDPNLPEAHSNLLYAIHFHPAYDAPALAEEHRRWNQAHGEPLARFIQPHHNDRNPERRLRIGYVSADFRDHAVARFLLPLLAHHDKSQVQIIAYAQVGCPDAMTQKLRSVVDGWRSIVGLSDSQAADLIREDQIDILVDLSGHIAGNRLPLMARKPAPVQVTYLGHPNTTGLRSIDYRFTDALADPPDQTEQFHSEQLVRLPGGMWCFDPIETSLPVNDLPAHGSGIVTFGCLNNFCKVNEKMLKLWAAVLGEVNPSRLILLGPEGSAREWVLRELQAHQIAPQRIEFRARRSTLGYLRLYHELDVALDPFPYHGLTTTCEALWMGVPVVTLAGRTHVSRVGVSLLHRVGLPELVAQTPEQYVQIAAALAADLPRLSELRQTLRQRMKNSPLMDAPAFARNIEAAYRRMWRTWCEKASR